MEMEGYNYETGDYYDYVEHTCTYSISTVCNPNFVDKEGRDCDAQGRYCKWSPRRWFLDKGIMTDEGFMTAFNCPQCGCTEENGPIRPNFATLHP